MKVSTNATRCAKVNIADPHFFLLDQGHSRACTRPSIRGIINTTTDSGAGLVKTRQMLNCPRQIHPHLLLETNTTATKVSSGKGTQMQMKMPTVLPKCTSLQQRVTGWASRSMWPSSASMSLPVHSASSMSSTSCIYSSMFPPSAYSLCFDCS